MIHSDTFCVGSRPRLESLDAPCSLGCASPKFGLEAALSLGEPGWSLDHTRVQAGIRAGLWQPFFLEYILIFVKSFRSYFTSSFSFLLFDFPSWFTCSPLFLMLSGHPLVWSCGAFLSSFFFKSKTSRVGVGAGSASQKAVLAPLEGKCFPTLAIPGFHHCKWEEMEWCKKCCGNCAVWLCLQCVIHQSNYMQLRNLRLLWQWHSPVAFLFPSN